MNLFIEKVLGSATIQGRPDLGRRRFGVPPGGAFDEWQLERLQLLMRAGSDSATIELCLGELQVVAESNETVAFVGLQATSETGHVLPENETVGLGAGLRYRFRVKKGGARGWLFAGSGVISPHRGDELANGDAAIVAASNVPEGLIWRQAITAQLGKVLRLRYIPEPRTPLLNGGYRVSLDSNRTGIRLEGEPLRPGREMPSEPACMGVIQLPPSGQPVILGPDGPTIGGYERIGIIVEADLHHLAQLGPFAEVSFTPVTLDRAVQLKALQLKRHSAERQMFALSRNPAALSPSHK